MSGESRLVHYANFVRLPHTGLEVDLPLVRHYAVTDQPDAGETPDVWVTPSVRAIAANEDAELAAVRVEIRMASQRASN